MEDFVNSYTSSAQLVLFIFLFEIAICEVSIDGFKVSRLLYV